MNNYGGDVGTNGNISLQGSATIDGTFSSPRTGVNNSKKLASCTTGTATEIAIDQTLATSVSECATASSCGSAPVQLSQPITLTNPTMPTAPSSWNTASAITVGSGTTCASLGLSGCSGSAGNLTFSPSSAPTAAGFPPIIVNGGAKLTLAPGTYNIDSISVSNGAALTMNATTGSLTVNTNSINLSGGNLLDRE